MPTTRTKILISIIAIALILILYINYGGGGSDFSDFAIGNISLFPQRQAFESASQSASQFVQNYTHTVGVPVSDLILYFTSEAPMSVGGEVLIYRCNQSEEVESGWVCGTPGEEPLLKLPIEYGKAVYEWSNTTATAPLYTRTPYAFFFHGTRQFYDSKLGDGNEAFIAGENVRMYEVDGVGRLVDMVNEKKAINGQLSTDLSWSQVEIGCYGGCEDGDVLIYDTAKGDNEVWMDITIGCGGYGAECRNVVLWFDFDFPKPEGNELRRLELKYVSGLDLHLPEDLLSYFKPQDMVYVGDMRSGETATYRLEFEFWHVVLDENDPFCLWMDDLNQHGDIYGGEKAKPTEVCFGFVD